MVNLDDFGAVLGVNREKKSIKVQAGIRLAQMNEKAAEYGLTLPNLGSIDEQSIAGALATGTHGSSMSHGTLGSYVVGLRLVLSNGSCVHCSPTRNEELFRAALVSLGALGILVEVEYQLVEDRNIEWVQTIMPLDDMLAQWNGDLWKQAEFTRIWWLPYTRKVIVWRASKTSKPVKALAGSWYDGPIGYHVYKSLLWVAHHIPSLLPTIEWFVFGMQYSFTTNYRQTAIESQRKGLLMNCLYSQFVNEWAIPLSNGPEAISKLDAWFHRSPTSALSLPENNVYIHAPIEVRISDISPIEPKAFLEQAIPTAPTLYLNATLYRPAGLDPPCREQYYATFESLMKSLGGRPHWAKNFTTVTPAEIEGMYGDSLTVWRRVRREVDPDGIFIGEWHRRTVLGDDGVNMACEEQCVGSRSRVDGGVEWFGGARFERSPGSERDSEESFDVFASAEAEASMLLDKS